MVVSIVILNEAKHKTFLVHGFHCETNTVLAYFPFLLLRNTVLYFRFAFLNAFRCRQTTPCLNLHSPHVKTHVIPSTDWYLPPLFLRQLKSARCCSVPAIPVLEEAAETIWCLVNAVSTCRNTFNIFRLSCNIQTLFYWGRKGELYTSYHIRLIS